MIHSAHRQFSSVHPLTVNYDMSERNLITLGKYEIVNPYIPTIHFPKVLSGRVKIGFRCFSFDHRVSSYEATKEMKQEGFRPGDPLELLTLGARYPDAQREMTLVELGASFVLGGRRRAILLGGTSSIRILQVEYWDTGWPKGTHFLGVQN